jgi:hypothetical protein
MVTVSGGKDKEAQPVWVYAKYRGRHPAQKWRIVYTDKMGDEAYQTKGVDKDFGLEVN